MRRLFAFLLAGVSLIGIICYTGAIEAAPGKPIGRGGITISPAFQNITLDNAKPEASFDFKLTNNTTQSQEYNLSVVDFGTLDESGGVLFVGPEKSLNYRYGLSSWAQLGADKIVIEAGKTGTVVITILNKDSLSPGGHYGAILVTPAAESKIGQDKVQINQVASTLLFVKKIGGETYDVKLKSSNIGRSLFSLPNTASLRFQNSGNVHAIPHGSVTITGPNGAVVKKGIVNTDSSIILPASFRQIAVPLTSYGRGLLPGMYTSQISYYHEGQLEPVVVTSRFLYANVGSSLVALLALSALSYVVVFAKGRQQFDDSAALSSADFQSDSF